MITITIDLMGGLGNQLFQIFTTMAHAIRHGEQFVFQNCELLPIGTTRPTYWNTLLRGLKPFLTEKSKLYPPTFDIYRENGFKYKALPAFTGNMKLHGYFQSIKYFQEEFDVIREICGINDHISIMRERIPPGCTAMHFRIVEYRSLPNHHPVAPYEYYVWAIKRTESKNILYFRPPEDTEEVRQIIQRLNKEFPDVVFTEADNTAADWEQMVMMACCDKHIIANSTFSWWGAVLAEPKFKFTPHVCYPANWFGPAYSYDIKDLVLPSWDGFNG